MLATGRQELFLSTSWKRELLGLEGIRAGMIDAVEVEEKLRAFWHRDLVHWCKCRCCLGLSVKWPPAWFVRYWLEVNICLSGEFVHFNALGHDIVSRL